MLYYIITDVFVYICVGQRECGMKTCVKQRFMMMIFEGVR